MRDTLASADPLHKSYQLRRPHSSGGCRPGDVSHLSIAEADSSWRSLLSRRSRWGPGCVFSSSAMMLALSAFRFSSNIWGCGRRLMALSFPYVNWAGAQPAFSSPTEATVPTVMKPICTRDRSDARTKLKWRLSGGRPPPYCAR